MGLILENFDKEFINQHTNNSYDVIEHLENTLTEEEQEDNDMLILLWNHLTEEQDKLDHNDNLTYHERVSNIVAKFENKRMIK